MSHKARQPGSQAAKHGAATAMGKFYVWWCGCLAIWLCSSGVAQTNAVDPGAAATPSAGESFARAFFISRITHANGEKSLDLFGSILLWILLLLSMLSIGLIGMMAVTNQRKAFLPVGVIDRVRKLFSLGKFREAIDLTSADESFFSKTLHTA